MYWHHGGGWGDGDWLAMIVMMVFFWGAVVALLVTLFRHVPARGRKRTSRAQELLAERFARGEIDEDEFRHRRDVLTGS